MKHQRIAPGRISGYALIRGAAVLFVGLSLTACSPDPLPPPAKMKQEIGDPVRNLVVPIRRDCSPANSTDYFFPRMMFSNDAHIDDALRAYWNAAFPVAHEPPLSCGTDPDEAYRVITAHSLSLDMWTVRVYRDRERHERRLYVANIRRDLYGTRFSEVGHVARELSLAEWTEVENEMTRAEFWSMPTEVVQQPYMDGGGMTVEGRRKQSYHVVARPLHAGSPFREILRLFRRLSAQDIDFRNPDC